MKKFSLLFVLAGFVWVSCGDDDGDGPGSGLVDFDDILDNWTDRTVLDGISEDAFIVVSFDRASATGTVTAASVNNEGIVCDDVIFREIEPADGVSFTAEGLISDGSATEWVPAIITVNSENEIAVAYECTGCNPAVDVLTRVTDGEEPVVPVLIDNTITSDRVLFNLVCDPDQPDYLVSGFVGVDAFLTIEPGVIIAFEANAGLVVGQFGGGAISAIGTSSEPIVFTGQTKAKGFWGGLVFETNDVRNELDYVIVEYAGSDIIADDILGGVRGGVSVDVEPGSAASSLKLKNSVLRENDGYGLIMEWFSQLREFSNNTFENNTDAAVLTEAVNVGALDASSSYAGGNGFDGVEIAETKAGNALKEDATWTSFDDGSVYYVSGDIEIEATLTILPGATFEFEANTEIVFGVPFGRPEGILRAIGTSDDPITFTGATKTPGYWQGIVIVSTSNQNEMSHCIVEYGGSDAILAGEPANITLDIFNFAPSLTITNSTIRNSAGCGIYVQSGNLTESDNTFSGNSSDDVCL